MQLNARQCAAFLTEAGYPIKPGALWSACDRGYGPPRQRVDGTWLYDSQAALAWARRCSWGDTKRGTRDAHDAKVVRWALQEAGLAAA